MQKQRCARKVIVWQLAISATVLALDFHRSRFVETSPDTLHRLKNSDREAVWRQNSHHTIENVSMEYQRGPEIVRALGGSRWMCREGEILCIVGSSGCGKSTLLNLIAGFHRTD